MKLCYYIDKRGNFGDDLNPWLWEKLIPSLIDGCVGLWDIGDSCDDEIFFGIGTILNNRIPKGPRKVVFGSGSGYGPGLPVLDDLWKIYCVRGPLTAAALKLPKSYAVTDAAALVSTVFDAKKFTRQGIAFIPHHASAWNLDWGPICAEAGVRYIDPRLGVDVVLREIAMSSGVIAEAMHGAIVADAFRVPWMPLVLYDHILGFKWHDWTQSLALPYSPAYLEGVFSSDYNYSSLDKLKIGIKRSFSMIGVSPKRWTPPPRKSSEREMGKFALSFRQIVENPKLVLSKDGIYSNAVGRLLDRLEQLKEDHSLNRRPD